jgi:hypothetical protein
MKKNLLLLLIALTAVCSCEKAILPENNNKKKDKPTTEPTVVINDSTGKRDSTTTEKKDTTDTGKKGNDNDKKRDSTYTAITVDSAMNVDEDKQICVIGYIIGTCSNTINKPTFSTATGTSSNIIIADNVDEQDKTHILTVCLTNDKEIRAALNIVDNPQNFHKRVIIIGTRAQYLHWTGLKSVWYYKFAD